MNLSMEAEIVWVHTCIYCIYIPRDCVGTHMYILYIHSQDARAVALNSDPSLGSSFVKALFAVLYEVFNSMVHALAHALAHILIHCIY